MISAARAGAEDAACRLGVSSSATIVAVVRTAASATPTSPDNCLLPRTLVAPLFRRSAHVLGTERLLAARPAPALGCPARALRLEPRYQMLFAVADQVLASHPAQRVAQHRPVLGIMVAEECLVQAPNFQPLRNRHV